MSRLIDANELQSEYKKYHDGKRSVLIDVAPTIDAVEVVRCKDCENWDRTWTNSWAKDYHYCPMVDGVRKVDFYCADAERRTDNANANA